MEFKYLLVIAGILHWFGDFIFQTDELSILKHKSFYQLIKHSIIYTLPFLFGGMFFGGLGLFNLTFGGVWGFVLITFGLHLLVDYFISKTGYVQYHSSKPNTFLGILVFDQIIHVLFLILTYILIFS